jgi:hypothetical protein
MENESPFPGMDPYVEDRQWWKGLHTQLIGKLSTDLLPPLLAPAYYVDPERSLQVLVGGDMYPDIEVTRSMAQPRLQPAGAGLPVMEATIVVDEPEMEEDEEDQESAIFIREARSEQLVTVIEILSYSNKTSGDEKRARYLLKRRALLRSGIHLVEIDLLRWGQRVVPGLPNKAYHILVSRADDRPHTLVWSFGLDEPIPAAPLPLIASNEQVPIPLQEAFTIIYQARNFRHRLDYDRTPDGPLRPVERAYIQSRLLEVGLRL